MILHGLLTSDHSARIARRPTAQRRALACSLRRLLTRANAHNRCNHGSVPARDIRQPFTSTLGQHRWPVASIGPWQAQDRLNNPCRHKCQNASISAQRCAREVMAWHTLRRDPVTLGQFRSPRQRIKNDFQARVAFSRRPVMVVVNGDERTSCPFELITGGRAAHEAFKVQAKWSGMGGLELCQEPAGRAGSRS